MRKNGRSDALQQPSQRPVLVQQGLSDFRKLLNDHIVPTHCRQSFSFVPPVWPWASERKQQRVGVMDSTGWLSHRLGGVYPGALFRLRCCPSRLSSSKPATAARTTGADLYGRPAGRQIWGAFPASCAFLSSPPCQPGRSAWNNGCQACCSSD